MYFQSVNGKQVSDISINDRGLAFGDGLFTTAKINGGKIEYLEQHIQRLQNGCSLLKIHNVNFITLLNNLNDISKPYPLAVIKIIITAGDGGRGYSRVGIDSPNIIIKVSEFPSQYTQWQDSGISIEHAKLKIGINPLLSSIKHLNRLEQVLLRDELDNTPYNDLLVFNIHNHLVETTCANVFWFEDDKLFTPVIKDCGVAGIMRNEILRKYPETHIIQALETDILKADSIFITNSIMEIVPVSNYRGNELNINKVHQFKKYIAKIK